MPTLRAELAAVECHLAQSEMPVLDATRFQCAAGLRCADAALGKGLLQITMAIAQLERPSWRIRSHRGREDKWARWLGCDELDAWECMYGTPEISHTAACPAPLVARGAHLARHNKTLVALVVLRNILARGDRRSPLLEPGPMPWPAGALPAQLAGAQPPARGAAAISVAVRGGDACDVVESTRLSPTLFQGVWDARLRTRWSKQKRHCAHPTVYLDALRELLARRPPAVGGPVGSVHLATDSAEAAAAFAREAPALGVRVHQRQWNRSKLTMVGGGARGRTTLADRKKRWIEFRDDLDPSVVVSALEDLRMLALGKALVGSMCSSFHAMAWNLAVAVQGALVPYESVDGCVPHLDVWPSLAGTTNDDREPRGLPTFTAEVLRGGPLWVGGGRSSRYPFYDAPRRRRSGALTALP